MTAKHRLRWTSEATSPPGAPGRRFAKSVEADGYEVAEKITDGDAAERGGPYDGWETVVVTDGE